MPRQSRHISPSVATALLFSTCVCLALFAFRFLYYRSFAYEFILWNLFLAWLPMLSALLATHLHRRNARLTWPVIIVCALAWLLFLPNAPYAITDLAHLREQYGVPFWYDLILMASYAWTACLLGLSSLLLMQQLVRRAVGDLGSWVFVVCVMGLSGFGIYLGRFLRWNSWDVLFSPYQLLRDIYIQLRHPFDYPRTFAFSILYALFFFFLYVVMVALAHSVRDTE